MAGKFLGELGQVKAAREDTFGWFGATIRVGDGGSDLKLLDFIEHAEDIDATDKQEQLRMVKDFLHSIVHEDDFAEFWRLALANNQSLQDLMAVMIAITEATTNRPTRRRSDSSLGRRATGAKSKRSSSSQEPKVDARKVAKRLERSGRPDRALMVVEAAEARRAG